MTLRTLKLTLQYLGTNYLGWQVQPLGPTIQSLLQASLKEVLQQEVTVFSAGRTDSGVHALAQVAHFKTEHPIDPSTLQRALNHKLPPDISILSVEEMASDFHAQKSAVHKTYAYLILNSHHRIPLLYPFSWRLYGELDLDAMHRCLEMLVGEHDFNAFKAADSNARSSVRRLLAVSVKRLPIAEMGQILAVGQGLESLIFSPEGQREMVGPSLLTLGFKGVGFLKHMIRNIVGTVVEVGMGRMTVQRFREIFESLDRTQAGRTAPPQGLFMVKVEYGSKV